MYLNYQKLKYSYWIKAHFKIMFAFQVFHDPTKPGLVRACNVFYFLINFVPKMYYNSFEITPDKDNTVWENDVDTEVNPVK